ncbi:MAG: cation-translocating P-type ATPase [Candidatus Methanomethylophilaceae archaeon]|nr:cation-translocating P-type ATPase [Candidatus Methanomethylophilaceae archaeon]
MSFTEFIKDDVKRSLLFLILSAVSLAVSFFYGSELAVDPAWVAIILCGTPILWDATTGLILRHDIKADVLVAIAIIAALALGEWFAAGEVALIMEIGGFLEDLSAAKANKGIEALVSMSPKKGRLVVDGSVRDVDVDDIHVGQVLRVLPGESVPVDGRIIIGETSIDQSVITGESLPVDKTVGDEVFSGTMNQMGTFDMVADHTAEESSFQRMVGMVSSVDAEKTRMVRTVDRWATWLVALVLVLAVATLAITKDVYRAVTVCIVFCPCAFILATPTAIVAAIGNLAKRGVLVRDGDSLERMSQVDIVAFDKTGTITEGRPKVAEIHVVGDDAVSLIASAESCSEHPLAKAFVRYAESSGVDYTRPDSFDMTVGHGIDAVVGGRKVRIGNMRMFQSSGIVMDGPTVKRTEELYNDGCTVVYVSIDGTYAGFIAFSDSIRPSAKSTVMNIEGYGVRTVLLTGDNGRAARHMAAEAGIADIVSECTPETKVSEIDRRQESGCRACMVGDGVNDAPALKKAWVGVAMGATGSDIAADASDIVLLKDGIESLPHLIGISRKMMQKVRVNITFSLVWNAMAVGLSMFAVLSPVTGALVHNLGSVAVVVNSALLLIYGRRKRADDSEVPPRSVAEMQPSIKVSEPILS